MAEKQHEKPKRDAKGRYLPGQSGNPKGGAKKWERLSYMMNVALDRRAYTKEGRKMKPVMVDGRHVTYRELVAIKAVDRLIKDMPPQLLQIVLNRTEGTLTHNLLLGGVTEEAREKLSNVLGDVALTNTELVEALEDHFGSNGQGQGGNGQGS